MNNQQNTTSSQVHQYRGLPLLQLFMATSRNYADAFYKGFLKHGDVISFNIRKNNFILFFHPDAVQAILKDQAKEMQKGVSSKELRVLLGNGIFLSEDEEWRNHRRIMAPEFHTDHFEGFSKVILEEINRLEIELEASAKTGEPRDLYVDMLDFTFKVAGRVFFGLNLSEDIKIAHDAITHGLTFISNKIFAPIKLPTWIPTPARRKAKAYLNALDNIVYKMIDQQQRIVDHQEMEQLDIETNVLLRMIKTGSKNKEDYLSHLQLRDEVVNLLIAAHDTSSNALLWTFIYLMQEKNIAQKVLDEIQATLRGSNAQLNNVQQLKYTEMVLKESMRLKPPVPTFSRSPTKPMEITGIPVYPNDTLSVSPYITHRHPDFWDNPLQFNPERFTTEASKNRHPCVYFPFAKGPRSCIGEHFAMVEMIMLLSSLLQKFEFTLVHPSKPIQEYPRITLGPKGKVMVKVKKR